MNDARESATTTQDEEKPEPRSLRAILQDLAEADGEIEVQSKKRDAALAELKTNMPPKRTAVPLTVYGARYRHVVYLVGPGPNGEPLIESADCAQDD